MSRKKKKLLFLVNSLGFFFSHRLEIAIEAKKKGYEVDIAYGDLGKANTTFLAKKGINFFQIPLERKSVNPFKEIWSLFFICKIFFQLKPDIVHLITIKAYLYGGIAGRISGVPCIISAVAGLGILFNKKKFFNIFFQKLLYLFFKIAFSHPNQKVIVQNLDDKKTLINWIALDSKKILLLKGSGVNLLKFTKFNEPKNNVSVCFASRLLHDKGVFDFISAAKILKKKGIKANFLIAGDLDYGNPSSLSKQEFLNIKNEKIVKVLGYQKDIPDLYSNSHIVCLPSYYGEGLPKALIEAAAASRAVVTTDTPGCRDAIIPNKTGLLVPARNPKKLSEAIQWLIEHSEERIEMGKAGRNLAIKEYSIENIVNNHIKIYKELCSKSFRQ